MTTPAPGAPTNQRNYNIMSDPGVSGNMTAEYKESLSEFGLQTMPVIDLIATDDATDPATVIVLANANKAKINEMLAALYESGIMRGTLPRPPIL